jgi:cyclohexa-1,5-dienecarbonyl-CoA hydratase
MSKVLLHHDDRSWRITLNDPPLNILDIAMLTELRDALAEVRADRPLLVIAAAGEKAFSAGASVQDHMGDRIETMLTTFHDCFRMLHRLELVSVALVKGLALGGGCELAFGCDFVLASERAKFGQPEINLGVFPPVAAWQLSRLLPARKGLELFLSGDPVDAPSAAALGVVNAVFPLEGFDAAAGEWMSRIARHSASSLRMAKRAFRLASADDFDQRLREVEQLYLRDLMKTEDANEGLKAFIEKRPPVWQGK